MLNDQEIAAIRSRFPIFRKKIYLNSCSQGALSDAVEDGFSALIESWHEFGSPWERWCEEYEKARNVFAAMIGAKLHEVAVLTSVSQGINAVASAFDYQGPRKTVILGEFEFPTMGHIWLAQQARGAQVNFLSATGDRLPSEIYARAINEHALIVPVTGVCFMNGFRSEVPAIVEAAHARGALVMLDDYQDCGTRPINVKALDVDFYLAGTLKYLLGPSGLAFLYVREELIARLTPTASGWFAQTNPFAFDVRTFDPAPAARRFEAGTPPIPNIYGALPGMESLREIGLDNVSSQISKLTRALLIGASALGIKSKTPEDSVGPLVVLQAKDVNALLGSLTRAGIIASGRHDGLRISFHVYNTLEDVDAVLRVLEKNIHLLVSESQLQSARG